MKGPISSKIGLAPPSTSFGFITLKKWYLEYNGAELDRKLSIAAEPRVSTTFCWVGWGRGGRGGEGGEGSKTSLDPLFGAYTPHNMPGVYLL